MLYDKIKNPESGKMVSITSKLGKEILTKYITHLNGGGGHTISKPTFRMFGVHWCGHCTRAKPIFESINVNGLEKKYIDCEKGENETIVNKFKDMIKGYPTFILSKENSNPVTFPQDKDRTRESIEDWLSSETNLSVPKIEESNETESHNQNDIQGPLLKFFNLKKTPDNEEPIPSPKKRRKRRKRTKSPKKRQTRKKSKSPKKRSSPKKRKSPKKK